MGRSVFVYGLRAFGEEAARTHHPRLRERLAERVETFGTEPRLVYRIDHQDGHRLTLDPVEVHRLRKTCPSAAVRVIPVDA